MTDPRRFVTSELIDLAMGAADRINREGTRGATNVSVDQIIAMACLLVILDTKSTPIEEDTP